MRWFLYPALVLFLVTNSTAIATSKNTEADLLAAHYRAAIGQKIIVDIRYFCPNKTATCQHFQTHLTPELKDLINRLRPSGLILFSENIKDSEQLLTFNYEVQAFAKAIGLPPLFIAVDQEGGRVSRLISADFPVFSGNMALGASYQSSQTQFARQVGKAMGEQLSLVGINLNFAPSVDVNSNPNNPIINVRAFSQFPGDVAALGAAFMDGLQQQNVISALKHFPGHGDTSVDSHVGLPLVAHDRSQINAVDLFPFKTIISQQALKGARRKVSMIMTAHIQYPKLDNSVLLNKLGNKIVVPATLSKQIIQGVLRKDMGFDGVVISDALDMAGIAQFFDQKTAMKASYAAGVDIALMPYSLKDQSDVMALENIIHELAQETASDEAVAHSIDSSIHRIERLKTRFALSQILKAPLNERLTTLREYLHLQPHKALAKSVAENAITQIKNDITKAQMLKVNKVIAIMPDELRCKGLEKALLNFWQLSSRPQQSMSINCYSMLSDNLNGLSKALALQATSKRHDTLFIHGDISPNLAAYETKGSLGILWRDRLDKKTQLTYLPALINVLQSKDISRVFVAMRSPYVIAEKRKDYAALFATYDYQVDPVSHESNALNSFIEVLFFHKEAKGTLPVQLDEG